uniref:Cation/H+ exchanger transmembrane domain-containing protein n=1 Tax=Prymnesium polylepis TaxID=72548 RepID=A0A7S4IL43_9EUKA|mmetsp:Transcript_32755/g.81417  ORF Transcript_32755/g.81417 Transcript_32755/m.81417 type:complete len:365 (+) Transcript_32755:2-1096(+)
MVFGESVLNDAVAIVLSNTLLSFIRTPVSADSILAAGGSFCVIFFGSMLVGASFGLLSSLAFKHLQLTHTDDQGQQMDNKFVELAISFCFPWCGYFVCEALEMSGIVAILACGMIMAAFTRRVMSAEAVQLTTNAYKGVATIAETFVFVYLGMAVVTFPIFNNTTWRLFLCALVACFIGRLHIFLGSWITNLFRGPASDPARISAEYSFIMWFSGLRGGVAFALASVSFTRKDFGGRCGGLPVGADCDFVDGMDDSTAMLQVTMLIALFTIFVFGGAISHVAVSLDVLEAKEDVGDGGNGHIEKINSRMSTMAADRTSVSGKAWKNLLETITHDSMDDTGVVRASRTTRPRPLAQTRPRINVAG